MYASTSGRSSLEGGNGAWMRPAWHGPPSDSIVSLVPSATEILFALGLGHRCALVPSLLHRPCASAKLCTARATTPMTRA